LIRLLGEGNVSYVSPAISEIIPFCERKAKGMSENMNPENEERD
tara:strand:- start:203 stop:334 length:132 start_codon:yes stop_codon:yes gene_type:complete